ncbi:kinesin-like protein KIN-10B [Beta vulgaris subsp. vulgaris]|uniref:kinesin-like protein KIN-10B n=1 Tax=Beta vulgaris subsp. vulgaris TaxID=3555 RepID=UPI0005401207|nr:kinesin-like protein KIN-10B [Beta vulgaris subsp. vulgaris]
MAFNSNSSIPAIPSRSSTTTSNVRVIVRVRPFLPHEIALSTEEPISCVSILATDSAFDDEISVYLKDQQSSRQECYKLDGFFGEEDNNVTSIFEKEVKPLIPGIFHGCNATVFAYGATGSGKTYTMQGTDVKTGLMPLAMSRILSLCQTTGSIAEISYYEVYLDRCYDLLELKAKEISVLDDRDGQIHLKGLSRVLVTSMSEFHDVFARGIKRRKVAHTGLNDDSSRSHAVLVVTLSRPSEQGQEACITGKLNLIDLAGNEDNRRSGNEGIRLQESAKINQSLFALSNVIYALNNNKAWVPYRETKLTRILQGSLGGTSRALMVACLNPGDYQEAVHTLSLAARSRQVSNVLSVKQETPKVKIDMEAKLQAWRESKGKAKSAQRKEAFSSPFFPKSPGYMSSMKKQAVSRNSVKAKAANQGATVKDSLMYVPQRKLFDTEATCDLRKDDSDCAQALQGLEELNLSRTNKVLTFLEDGQPDRKSASQYFVNSYCCLSEAKEPVAQDNVKQYMTNSTRSESTACSPELMNDIILRTDELSKEDEATSNKVGNFIQSPPNRPKIQPCQSPLRKALSPVNCNIIRMPIEEVSSRDCVLSLLHGSSDPKTPFMVTRGMSDFDTPMEKYYARSSSLKSYLAQEYIDFLNTATREQLVELKGIGVKRAEYIVELRESSPLQSLSDLEKIGLSSKQVQYMFNKAAKDIFG